MPQLTPGCQLQMIIERSAEAFLDYHVDTHVDLVNIMLKPTLKTSLRRSVHKGRARSNFTIGNSVGYAPTGSKNVKYQRATIFYLYSDIQCKRSVGIGIFSSHSDVTNCESGCTKLDRTLMHLKKIK